MPARSNKPKTLPFKNKNFQLAIPNKKKVWSSLKQIIQLEEYHKYPVDVPTYTNIDASPSLKPTKKYCDVTGFHSTYLDPKTNLRYANANVFHIIRNLTDENVQKYLEIRNAAVILK